MFGTMRCVYETPCGWCSKWDKKCDEKIGCNINKFNGTPLPSDDYAKNTKLKNKSSEAAYIKDCLDNGMLPPLSIR